MGEPSAPNLHLGEVGEPSEGSAGARSWRRSLERFDWGAYGIVIGTVAIWLIFNVTTGGLFLSPRNLTLLLVQTAGLGMLASGAVLIMVSGNIDLSAGSSVGLCMTMVAIFQVSYGWDTLPAIAAVVLIGMAIGVWQGLWIAYAGIPAFIVTLASLSLLRGLAFIITNGQTFSPMSPSFESIANGSLVPGVSLALVLVLAVLYVAYLARSAISTASQQPSGRAIAAAVGKGIPVLAVLAIVAVVGSLYKGIPYPVIALTAVALAVAFVALRTRYGRHIYAIGGNREAAILAGVNVSRHVFLAFVGMGILYALAGSLLASRLNGAIPDAALGLELDVITACILGGTSLFGGVGTIQGAVLGSLLLTSLNSGMELLGFSTFMQWVVKGCVLLLAVLLDVTLKRRRAA